jgi:hypothetical protein
MRKQSISHFFLIKLSIALDAKGLPIAFLIKMRYNLIESQRPTTQNDNLVSC